MKLLYGAGCRKISVCFSQKEFCLLSLWSFLPAAKHEVNELVSVWRCSATEGAFIGCHQAYLTRALLPLGVCGNYVYCGELFHQPGRIDVELSTAMVFLDSGYAAATIDDTGNSVKHRRELASLTGEAKYLGNSKTKAQNGWCWQKSVSVRERRWLGMACVITSRAGWL